MDEDHALVDTVGHPSRRGSVLVSLGEKVNRFGVWIEYRRPYDSDKIGDIGATSKVALQERGLNLTGIDGGASRGIDGSDPVLARRQEDQLLAAIWRVHERLGIPQLLRIVLVGPQDTEDGGIDDVGVHIMIG